MKNDSAKVQSKSTYVRCCTSNAISSHVRVVNLITGLGNDTIDVNLGDFIQCPDMSYCNCTKYYPIRTGGQCMSIRLSRSAKTLILNDFIIAENEYYTFALLGDIRNISNDENENNQSISVELIRDSNTICRKKGFSNVRFFHGSNGIYNADLRVCNEIIFHNVSFGNVDCRKCRSYQGFPVFDRKCCKKIYDICATQTVSKGDEGELIVFTENYSVEFDDQCVYTVFLKGKFGDDNYPCGIFITRDWPELRMDENCKKTYYTERDYHIIRELEKNIQTTTYESQLIKPYNHPVFHYNSNSSYESQPMAMENNQSIPDNNTNESMKSSLFMSGNSKSKPTEHDKPASDFHYGVESDSHDLHGMDNKTTEYRSSKTVNDFDNSKSNK
mgnify:CR=1 FL=1